MALAGGGCAAAFFSVALPAESEGGRVVGEGDVTATVTSLDADGASDRGVAGVVAFVEEGGCCCGESEDDEEDEDEDDEDENGEMESVSLAVCCVWSV